MLVLNAGEAVPPLDSLTTEELQIMERTDTWRKTGLAFALEHGTRPSTVGLAISSNPITLLAWYVFC